MSFDFSKDINLDEQPNNKKCLNMFLSLFYSHILLFVPKFFLLDFWSDRILFIFVIAILFSSNFLF